MYLYFNDDPMCLEASEDLANSVLGHDMLYLLMTDWK